MRSRLGESFRYNISMERILDKGILLFCCSSVLLYVGYNDPIVVTFLCALLVSAFRETSLFTPGLRAIPPLLYGLLTLAFPAFFFFTPLMAYDCFRMKPVILKVFWVLPFLFVWYDFSLNVVALVAVFSSVACILSWRTSRTEHNQGSFKQLRDESRELSLALERKNQELQEKQDYEVKLATLAERGRIAREIHDNVGHLLTRSVLQIEALQVVHAEDPLVKEELEQVGLTVHEAFSTVRESVHDLHDDAFDLNTQLFALAKDSPSLKIDLEYESADISPAVGYCFLAIMRESLANSIKHSDATHMKVSVVDYPAFWQLTVHDNGSVNPFVFDNSPFRTARQSSLSNAESLSERVSGIGLKTMEERTRALEGLFRVDYDRGFRVFVSIPKEKRLSARPEESDEL